MAIKIVKQNNMYYVIVKRTNAKYPFTIHQQFFTKESAQKWVKLNRKKYQ